ncbi:pseudouridine synthase [Sinanaerobacter sp. ZZT-01]|uniref:pseudouridine synthase n=1 Tax=Sinanaerobacter sp. ZZT-01 TaxID=3111540 RepID=UPI002D798DD0|nr:pseudouridine synthase [Sinanaerobacter sp. ZZT-01]WRR94543.1 pseudouridine synthase [Sinanaerobacter sp. ZZT-01]
MRLNKYIAQSGIASRRKADELTIAGNVKINGTVMRKPGYDVVEGDIVEVSGRKIEPVKKLIYLMLNKPKGFVTTVSDEDGRATVLDLLTDVSERIFPIGRLDYNTSGLLLLTNDGDLAYRLTHPKHKIYKTYRARVNGIISDARLAQLRNGVDIGGFVTSQAKVKVLKGTAHTSLVEIQIYEGKNRQVRKMFASVGNKVIDLERVAMGELYLGRLKEGHYRKLTQEEINYLKNC